MNALPLNGGDLFAAALRALDVEVPTGMQLWTVEALLAAARPAGLPPPDASPRVASYAETQGLGPYAPPAAPFPLLASVPALLVGAPGADWPAVARLLLVRYPGAHPARLASLDATGIPLSRDERPLAHVAGWRAHPAAALHLWYLHPLPASDDLRSAEGLRWVVARLLGPGGCPWDVRQTPRSLRAALLEEVHEVLEALDSGDMAALSEELGDLLITVFSQSEMARQAGHFALEDVFEQVSRKLIGRHPHVFGALAVEGEGQVLRNWEQIKAAEHARKGRARGSILDGVPPTLPALAMAQKLGKKAARAGFNWNDIAQVWAKLQEELDELAEAASVGDPAHTAEELGDTLFVLTRLADWLGLDAETALREASARFRRRFSVVEAAAARQGRSLDAMSLDELMALWETARKA